MNFLTLGSSCLLGVKSYADASNQCMDGLKNVFAHSLIGVSSNNCVKSPRITHQFVVPEYLLNSFNLNVITKVTSPLLSALTYIFDSFSVSITYSGFVLVRLQLHEKFVI